MTKAIDMKRTESFDNVESLSATMTEPVNKGYDDIEANIAMAKGKEPPRFATPQLTLPAPVAIHCSAPASTESRSWGQRIQSRILTTLRSGARNTSAKAKPQSPLLQRSCTGDVIADRLKRASPKRAERRSLETPRPRLASELSQ
jgi:hypothetical protein